MKPESFAGIVRYSPDPDRLARFYREALNIQVAPTRHGPVKTHHEALFGGVHFAIWGASEGRIGEASGASRGVSGEAVPSRMPASIVPVFRVPELAAASAEMARLGVPLKFGPIDLGEGKMLASFVDPDGPEFRLIQLQ